MENINLEEVRDTLVEVAFEAGRMMLAADPSSIGTDTKLNSTDIVTECDKAVEEHVSTRLRAAYPAFAFVGEETYQAGVTRVTDAPTFICDPIDGTTNFVHGFPWACISLGLTVARRPVVGVVYSPFLDTLYTAVHGRGAFMQRNASLASADRGQGPRLRLPLSGGATGTGRPLRGGLAQALVVTEIGTTRDGPNFATKWKVMERLVRAPAEGGKMCQNLRALGSAALNLCAVAAGQVDAYWEGGVWAWDVAAGWCVLEEAGGLLVSGNPGEQGAGGWEADIEARVYLAVRGASEGQKELVEEFWALMAEVGRLDYAS